MRQLIRALPGSVIVLLMSSLLTAQDSGKPTLQWKLKKGEILTYTHTIDQTFSLKSDASSFQYNQNIQATERIEIEEVTAEGNYLVRYQVSKLRVTVDGTTIYDSANPKQQDPKSLPLFRDAVGTPRKLIMTPAGTLVGSKTRASTRERFNNTFGGTGKGVEVLPLAVITLPFPEQDQASRKEWKIQANEKTDSGIQIFSVTNYKLHNPEKGRHGIVGNTIMSLQGAPDSMKLREGSGKQTAEFDLAAGHLNKSQMDFTVSVENQIDGKKVEVLNVMKSSTELTEHKKK